MFQLCPLSVYFVPFYGVTPSLRMLDPDGAIMGREIREMARVPTIDMSRVLGRLHHVGGNSTGFVVKNPATIHSRFSAAPRVPGNM